MMATIYRQDAWKQEEDTLLAETVINHIRAGNTQLSAFKEVGEKLSRTSSACGFRWNSKIRKIYEKEVSQAKQSIIRPRSTRVTPLPNNAKNDEVHTKESAINISFNEVLDFLQALYHDSVKLKQLQVEQNVKTQTIEDLNKQIQKLTLKNAMLSEEIEKLESDYKLLMEIMERARQMAMLSSK